MQAALSDVDEWRTRERPAVAQGARVWGPVKARVTALAGCSRGGESVCIKPAVPPLVGAAALGCVPTAVRPTSTDTHESLRMRLGRSTFLDDRFAAAHHDHGADGVVEVLLAALSVRLYERMRTLIENRSTTVHAQSRALEGTMDAWTVRALSP